MPFFRPAAALLIIFFFPSTVVGADDARLPEPSFPLAASLWRDGKPAEALAALETDIASLELKKLPPPALVMRAELLAACGRTAEAEAAWFEVAAVEPTLKTFALRRITASRAGRGDAAGAAESLVLLMAVNGDKANIDLITAVADAQRDAGLLKEAASLYSRALRIRSRGRHSDAARLGLASCFEAMGEITAALEQLRNAQLNHSSVSTVISARNRARKLAESFDVELRPLDEKQYLSLVRSIRAASRYREAFEVIEDWRKAFPESKSADRIELEAIETLYKMRSNQAAVARCAAFYNTFPKSDLRDDVRYVELRLAVRLGKTAEVKSIAAELRGPGVSRSLRHNAGLVLASYLVSIGDVEGGLGVYRQVYRAAVSRSAKRDILWRAGVAALRAGQDARAAANLRALVSLNPGSDLVPAAYYWLAVAEQRLGRREAALMAALRLDERYPYHYYGIRARMLLPRLAEGFSASKILALRKAVRLKNLSFPKLKISNAAAHHELYRGAVVLARAGLLDEAADQLLTLLARRPSDKSIAFSAVRASAEAGDYRRALGLLATHFRSFLLRPAEGLPPDFWSLAYPRPFWKEVTTAASIHGVDPVLLLALMRQESRFDPKAVSAAGAVGLFQIMPYTAERLGPQLGLGHLDGSDLTDPKVNSLLGAKVLAVTMGVFDGYFVPAIAAYNAGEGRVGAWWKAGRGLPDDLFIDSMPYQETRRFVREVLTNYFTYNRLYAPQERTDEGS